MDLHELGVTEAVRAMRSGEISPVEMVQALLDRIAATEPRVDAWEAVDADGALAAARRLETGRRERLPREMLFGLPVGIKDIFHVRGLPTTANFAPYRDRVAGEDSAAVRLLREAGAIIMGKTVTVQFATGRTSPKTRNPWNPSLTPGGSSSGSAAAVGARQVPAALGTQTGGSVLRPASYCGIVGLKPTFGRISRHGLFPLSWSFDHPGILVRSVADAALMLQVLARHDPRDPFSAEQEPEDFASVVRQPGGPPRLGLLIDLLDRARPEVREAAESAARRLAEAGAEVREVQLPVPMDLLLAVHLLIRGGEAAEIHAEQCFELPGHYEPALRASIEVSQLVPAAVTVRAARLRRRFRAQMEELVAGVDAIMGPTVSTLPQDRSKGTGDASFQTIWSLFGFPNMSLPIGVSPDGLPHGMQVVSGLFAERKLLRVAAWCESVFGPLPSPLR